MGEIITIAERDELQARIDAGEGLSMEEIENVEAYDRQASYESSHDTMAECDSFI